MKKKIVPLHNDSGNVIRVSTMTFQMVSDFFLETRGSKEPVIAHLTQSCFGKVWPWWQIPRGSNIKL